MVTEVMHLHIAFNVYLDGEKPGISAGFDIKEVSLVETSLLPIAGEWTLHFVQSGMPFWNGSCERPGYHSNCISRGLINKDSSHCSHNDLWVS